MKKPPIPFPLIEKMEDRPLVWCLLKKMELETGQFFYGMYWPLFCKLFRFYYTDCDNEIEVADEIHLHIMTPPKNSTQTRLELFNFQCRLARWMKVVSVHYYYTKGKRHRKLTFFESAEDIPASNDGGISATVGLDREDFEKILDPIATKHIEELLLELQKEVTILIVTHNMGQAKRISSKSMFMSLGELVEYGDTETMFTNPIDERTKAYLTGKMG